MNPEDQDPLEALRQAWQNEEAPLPPIELEQQDETTQAIVQSLQQAWRAEAAQPRTGDLGLHAALKNLQANGVLAPSRMNTGVRWRLAACAAVALVLFGVWGHSRFTRSTLPVSPAGPDATTPLIVADSNAEFPQIDSSDSAPLAVTEWSLRPDGFEKQAGSVRLVLVEPTRTAKAQSTTAYPLQESLGDPK